jgi:hypothetical protein
MGLVLTTARRSWQNRNQEVNQNASINNPLNANIFGDNSLNGNNSIGTQANSRLNLINQLVTFSSAANRKSKANANANLNDFQNVSFSSHFFLAGRKFKNLISQAQTFLFGDQLDLAFILSHRPVYVRLILELNSLKKHVLFFKTFNSFHMTHPHWTFRAIISRVW